MSLVIYGHPFSSYCQKVLAALHEADAPYVVRIPGDPAVDADFAALWPLRKMPVLVDGPRTLMESSIIVEYLALHRAGAARLLPHDPERALDVRFMDRFFDNYIMTPMQRIVDQHMRDAAARDSRTVVVAEGLLDRSYAWLDARLGDAVWACGTHVTMADCAAAPALFYADWVHRIGDAFPRVQAYRRRLLAWPSFARAVDMARPYRHFFPLGAPDRD